MVERTEADELTARQKEILATLIHEYVSTAQPVGSVAICSKCTLGVSSATVRNELALLEEMGYLMQPHTSAGRVPTEKGYRYFVTRLMDEAELPAAEQRMIRHQFHQVRMDLDQWMRLTAAVLAHSARAASLVTSPHTLQARVRHIKLVTVSDTMALIVLVLYGGKIRQEMIPLAYPISQNEMEVHANRLNALSEGLTTAEIGASVQMLDAFEHQVLQRLIDMMWEEERQRGLTLYRDGLLDVLEQPEFAEAERARHIVSVLEQRSLLDSVLKEAMTANGVHVIIGGEGRWEEMEDYSIVLANYGNLGRVSGALGVLGPLRMPYRRAVSAVRYVSRLLSELISDLSERDASEQTDLSSDE